MVTQQTCKKSCSCDLYISLHNISLVYFRCYATAYSSYYQVVSKIGSTDQGYSCGWWGFSRCTRQLFQIFYILTICELMISICLEKYTIGYMNLKKSLFLTHMQYVVQTHILVFIHTAGVSDQTQNFFNKSYYTYDPQLSAIHHARMVTACIMLIQISTIVYVILDIQDNTVIKVNKSINTHKTIFNRQIDRQVGIGRRLCQN